MSDRPPVSGFRLRRRVSEEPGSQVFLAIDEETDNEVVLKIAADPLTTTLETFDEYVFSLISVSAHPALVTVHGGGITDDGHPFLVLQPSGSKTLRDRHSEADLPLADALRVMIRVASAVQHLHAASIIHGAVCLEHVFVTEVGKVLLGGVPLPGQRSTLGLAPEVMRGHQPDEQSDVYGLGAATWELVANQSLPMKLQKHLSRAVADDQRHRLATAREFIDGLQEVQLAMGDEVTNVASPKTVPAELADRRDATAHLDAVTQLRVVDPDTVTKVRDRHTWEESSLDAETRINQATGPAPQERTPTVLPSPSVSQEREVFAFDPAEVDFSQALYKPRTTPDPTPRSLTQITAPVPERSERTASPRATPHRPQRNIVVVSTIGVAVVVLSAWGIFSLLA